MDSYSRIRSIKLKRPTPEHPFGFSVRGGHEHGTGIFVSFVDIRSLAYRQGLKVSFLLKYYITSNKYYNFYMQNS